MTVRDSQRSRVYAAESALDGERSVLWTRIIGDREGDGVTHREVQAYVDALMRERWFQARWGQPSIVVKWKAHGAATGYYRSRIVLPPWARQERVVLHELGHVFCARRPAHGPAFAGVYLTLVRFAMGTEAAQVLRAAFRKARVRVSMADVPSPDPSQVHTLAQDAEAKRRAKVAPVGREAARAAAGVIRRLVAQGHYGEAGRKSREHALATARRLEELVEAAPAFITQERVELLRSAARRRR